MTKQVEVFVRKASGLVREMSPYSAFAYNVLAIGILFPWIYLWGPAAFPKANIALGVILTGVMLLPMWYTYSWLSASMPRSGGDYVFQTRILSGWIGFSVTMMGAVVAFLYASFAGWMLSAVGISPMLAVWSYQWQSVALLNLAKWFSSPWGVVIVSLVALALATYVLIRGMGRFVQVQWYLWYGLLISIAVIIVKLAMIDHATFIEYFNAFYAWIGQEGANAAGGFSTQIINQMSSLGFDLSPGFSWLQTLGFSTIAANSLVWAILAVQQLGEIKGASVVKNTTFFMVGSGVFSTVVMSITAFLVIKAAGSELILALGQGWLTGAVAYEIEPWIGLLSSLAALTSPFLVFLVCLGVIANAVQVMHNVMIQSGRITFAAAIDRLFGDWLSEVHPRFRSPVNMHVVLAIAIAITILLYNLWPAFGDISLSAAAGFTVYFVVTCISGALFPYLKHVKPIYEASPIAKMKFGGVPLITICGVLGAVVNAALFVYYMAVPELGVYSPVSIVFMAGTFIFFVILYFVRRSSMRDRGVDIELAFKQLPPD